MTNPLSLLSLYFKNGATVTICIYLLSRVILYPSSIKPTKQLWQCIMFYSFVGIFRLRESDAAVGEKAWTWNYFFVMTDRTIIQGQFRGICLLLFFLTTYKLSHHVFRFSISSTTYWTCMIVCAHLERLQSGVNLVDFDHHLWFVSAKSCLVGTHFGFLCLKCHKNISGSERLVSWSLIFTSASLLWQQLLHISSW